jgi:hypothetical protein
MSFWTSGTGKQVTGKPEDSFIKDFTVIPDGTTAEAVIKSFALVEKENKYQGTTERFYEIIYQLCTGDYKGAEVSQKIKAFSGDARAIDRNINMLKLVFDLCSFKPTHSEAPTTDDVAVMKSCLLSIKIREWSVPKADGSGMLEGNFVSEVHKAGAIPSETGVKLVVVNVPVQQKLPLETALNRNAGKSYDDLSDDLPF